MSRSPTPQGPVTQGPTPQGPVTQGPVTLGPITQAPIVQGWCPGALRPMMSGDGLVVRVRPRGGWLSPVQATAIAELAQRHGNGLIDLSSRANVQLRGVTTQSHPALIAGLAALDLIDATPQAESARNITVTPFWMQDDGTQDLASALMHAVASPDAPVLPDKFGYALDTDATPVLRAVSADIRVARSGNGLLVWADGASTGAVVATPQAAIAAVQALASWFVQMGGVVNGRGRMAALVARGPALPELFHTAVVPAAPPYHPQPGLVANGALVAFEFGQMQAETLALLAALGPLRVTPWRMLLVAGLRAMPDIAGLITRADDPLLRVVACTGAPGCSQAHQPTRTLARAIAPLSAASLVHVAGCAKGCAHPAQAPVTLVATPDGFNLIRNGTAADTAAGTAAGKADLRAVTLKTLIAHPDLLTELSQ